MRSQEDGLKRLSGTEEIAYRPALDPLRRQDSNK